MKITRKHDAATSGNALVITIVLTATALVILAGVLSWSNGSARLDARSGQFNRSLSAAEAATQKAVGQLWSDFQSGGEPLVLLNLNQYRTNVPSAADSPTWASYQFSDAQGNMGRTYVQSQTTSNYTAMTGVYAGLNGFVSIYDVVSDASETTDYQSVTAGNFKEVQLNRIPIFQFLLYSSEDLEVGCTQAFGVGGNVHANGNVYSEPDSVLVYDQPVTAVGNIVYGRSPQDYSRPAPSGIAAYLSAANSGVTPLILPIGTNNTPAAIQQIIQVPPAGEDPTSPLGRARYYNQSDMIINVSSAGLILGCSGRFNSFITSIPSNQMAAMVTLTNSFYDGREKKTVKPIDIDIGLLTSWSATNNSLRTALGGRDLCSVYVQDNRPLGSSYLPAVRVRNGAKLPPLGLTVSTALPLYVLGTFNQTNLSYTASATGTMPASLVSDAVTILSSNWVDANSTLPLVMRPAADNIVIAGLLTGAVYTTNGNYSGGMEHFMRLLEDWSHSTFWYTGSMIKMFPSAYATNYWPGSGTVYNYPANNHFYYDLNFNSSTGLPPLTPSMETITLNKWMTVLPNQLTGTNTLF